MPSENIAVVKLVYAAFAARDRTRLAELSSEDMILQNAVTGSAIGQERYVGREALSQFLADVDEIWTRLELRPRTFHSPSPGHVLVAGAVFVERGGHGEEASAAWSWTVVEDKVTYVRVLPTAEAYRMIAATAT